MVTSRLLALRLAGVELGDDHPSVLPSVSLEIRLTMSAEMMRSCSGLDAEELPLEFLLCAHCCSMPLLGQDTHGSLDIERSRVILAACSCDTLNWCLLSKTNIKRQKQHKIDARTGMVIIAAAPPRKVTSNAGVPPGILAQHSRDPS
jgi:hypothetical protein